MARPLSKNPRSKVIQIRITPVDLEALNEAAFISCMTLSAFLRCKGLSAAYKILKK